MKLFFFLQSSKAKFSDHIAGAANDIDWLFARYYGQRSLTGLYELFESEVSEKDHSILSSCIEVLQTGCPLEYILGEAYFDGDWYLVNQHTLIPRPETEELLSLAEKIFRGKKINATLELGCGSGCVAVGLKKRFGIARVCCSDKSLDALSITKKNANRMGYSLELRAGNWFDPWKGELFDLIVSNPPYLSYEEWKKVDRSVFEFEPVLALVSGTSGLEVFEYFAANAREFLVEKGTMIVEIGASQADCVKACFLSFGWSNVVSHKDMFGKDRFLSVTK